MLILNATNLQKFFGDRQILDISHHHLIENTSRGAYV